MRRRPALPFVLTFALLYPPFVRLAGAQSVSWFTFEPFVIPSSYTQPVLFEAAVGGSPARVTLDVYTIAATGSARCATAST
jgi:hypothetical protein